MSADRPWLAWARQANYPNLLRAPRGFNLARDWDQWLASVMAQVNFGSFSPFYGGGGARAFRSQHVSKDVGIRIQWDLNPDDPRLRRTIALVINGMMKEAVEYAKANHMGWEDRTGEAEKSIRVMDPAPLSGRRLQGEWGGGNNRAWYFLFLELNYGTLRNAHDVIMDPKFLVARLDGALRASGWAKPYRAKALQQVSRGLAPLL